MMNTKPIQRIFAVIVLVLFCFCSILPISYIQAANSTDFEIEISVPDNSQNADTVSVTIEITDKNNIGIEKAEVKLGQNGKWQDITKLLKEQSQGIYKINVGVQTNGTIYIRITDTAAKTYTEDCAVTCFEKKVPVIHVSLSGKKLLIETQGSNTEIKAIYIGSHSITDLQDGTLEVNIKDYISNSQKKFSVYAVDNKGNQSEPIEVTNPYYESTNNDNSTQNSSGSSTSGNNSGSITHDFYGQGNNTPADSNVQIDTDTKITIPPGTATKKQEKTENTVILPEEKKETTTNNKDTTTQTPITEQTPVPTQTLQTQTPAQPVQPTTQMPNVTINIPSAPNGTTSTPYVPTAVSSPAPSQTQQTQQTQPSIEPDGSITPTSGVGTVIENSTQTPQTREFFTIQTKAGNTFYIVVDKQKQQDNVYLLAEVTENDLLGFINASDTLSGKETPKEEIEPPKIILPQPEIPKEDITPIQPEKPEKKKGAVSTIFLTLLVMIVAFGSAYYVKIYKPRLDEEEDDEEDYIIEESDIEESDIEESDIEESDIEESDIEEITEENTNTEKQET